MPPVRFELTTRRLKVGRSNQLSYGGIWTLVEPPHIHSETLAPMV